MTNDRASLGARIAEAMGWERTTHRDSCGGVLYATHETDMDGDPVHYSVSWLVSWHGYGIVDAWMREQGWRKHVQHFVSGAIGVEWERDLWHLYGATAGDEPLAALQAALKAMEARE